MTMEWTLRGELDEMERVAQAMRAPDADAGGLGAVLREHIVEVMRRLVNDAPPGFLDSDSSLTRALLAYEADPSPRTGARVVSDLVLYRARAERREV